MANRGQLVLHAKSQVEDRKEFPDSDLAWQGASLLVMPITEDCFGHGGHIGMNTDIGADPSSGLIGIANDALPTTR